MRNETIDFYNQMAAELCVQYDSADMSQLYELIRQYVPAGVRVVEIGCGSGRDACRLSQLGYTVTACDASREMLVRAKENPVGGNVEFLCKQFPLDESDTLFNGRYNVVLSVAMLMHLFRYELRPFIGQIARLLDFDGVCVLSWCNRESVDVRHYEDISVHCVAELLEEAQLGVVKVEETQDSLGRPVIWNQIVARKVD